MSNLVTIKREQPQGRCQKLSEKLVQRGKSCLSDLMPQNLITHVLVYQGFRSSYFKHVECP